MLLLLDIRNGAKGRITRRGIFDPSVSHGMYTGCLESRRTRGKLV